MGKHATGSETRELRGVISSDGTRIACDVFGDGPPIIFITGMLSDRTSLAELARDVAGGATSIIYDRRGRGDSDAGGDYAVSREVEDVAAIAALFDAPPVLFGHSSGAGLAIEAAASGLRLAGLILYEPPYGPDDADSRAESAAFASAIEAKLATGDRSGAVSDFFEAMGMPPEAVEMMAKDPCNIARAPTMAHDFAVMGQVSRGGVVPKDLLEQIVVPALVLTGGKSPEFFAQIAAEVAAALPKSSIATVPQADHTARSDRLPRMVLGFLTSLKGEEA
jgi:pimeloyl-ACP methyl ester carboxylesterase